VSKNRKRFKANGECVKEAIEDLQGEYNPYARVEYIPLRKEFRVHGVAEFFPTLELAMAARDASAQAYRESRQSRESEKAA